MANQANPLYAPYGAYAMKAAYQKNLAAANLLTALAVGAAVLAGTLWPANEEPAPPPDPSRVISMMDLGGLRPQSIVYDVPELAVPQPQRQEAVAVGIPTPVPDEEYAGERDLVMASPREIAENLGRGADAGGATGVIIDTAVREFIPEPTTFVPTEIPPRLVQQYKGDYPRLAEMIGATGTAQVWVLLDEEGKPREARLAQSTGTPALDEAALAWAMKCTYAPGIQNGRPIKLWVTIKYTFEL